MGIENKEQLKDKIKAIIKDVLVKRDGISDGLRNLRAKKAKLEQRISANAEKRSGMVLKEVENTTAGRSDGELDRLIVKSQEQETIDRAALAAIEKVMPVQKSKLEQAEFVLKRRVLDVLKELRPDAEINAIAVTLKDAVEQWQADYNEIIQDLDINLSSVDTLADWRLPLDPHLSNVMIKWFNDFVPDIMQPEIIADTPPAERFKPVVAPKIYSDAEAQADARQNGRGRGHSELVNQPQAVRD